MRCHCPLLKFWSFVSGFDVLTEWSLCPGRRLSWSLPLLAPLLFLLMACGDFCIPVLLFWNIALVSPLVISLARSNLFLRCHVALVTSWMPVFQVKTKSSSLCLTLYSGSYQLTWLLSTQPPLGFCCSQWTRSINLLMCLPFSSLLKTLHLPVPELLHFLSRQLKFSLLCAELPSFILE